MQIKKEFGIERYVTLNLERQQKSLLAQLRLGILPLHIETGRFQNKKLEDRVCTICNSGAVESEYHFLFYCNYYKKQRDQFYQEISLPFISTDGEKLQFLSLNYTRKFARFVCQIFSLRKDKIYAAKDS